MVDDNIPSMSYGPIDILTRQPTQERSQYGRLRFSEMKLDCFMVLHTCSRSNCSTKAMFIEFMCARGVISQLLQIFRGVFRVQRL
ncbi:hypothetical protein BHE74_00032665 [Ensete ventricosum]|nr:hypothetical protein BHE74_00032665 [Ensete ventricosum]